MKKQNSTKLNVACRFKFKYVSRYNIECVRQHKQKATTQKRNLSFCFVSFVSFHLFLISFVSFRLTVVLSINIFYSLRSSKMCSCKSDCPPISIVGIKSTPDPSVVVHLTSESEIHALLLHSTASKDTLMT